MDITYPRYTSYEVFSTFNDIPANAFASLKGGPLAPNLRGQILLYQLTDGVYIRAYIVGIPTTTSTGEKADFHGFHIHEFGNCTVGDPANPFTAAGGHWNPTNQPHPFHAGDLPPILATNGIGMLTFYDAQFKVKDVIGKSFILHEKADDFMTQPAGNSGLRLACGVIKSTMARSSFFRRG